jgi:hypothetical protein
MAALILFNQFFQNVGRGVHNLHTNTLKVALTNSAPNIATQALLSDITQIANGNGYTTGGFTLAGQSFTLDSAVAELLASDLVITASGGTMATWRYPVLYDDTPSSPLDPLIGYLDVGGAIALADGQSRTLDFSATNGLIRFGAGTIS